MPNKSLKSHPSGTGPLTRALKNPRNMKPACPLFHSDAALGTKMFDRPLLAGLGQSSRNQLPTVTGQKSVVSAAIINRNRHPIFREWLLGQNYSTNKQEIFHSSFWS